jgi:heme a synthase
MTNPDPMITAERWRRPVGLWLALCAALVFAIVLVGGATRLTDSGLSITEWQLVTGMLPPLSEQAWLAELEKYRGTTEYEMINKGFGLAEFKVIYLWEWGHRLLGRVIGLVFLIGLVWFWLRGAFTRPLLARLVGVFALICLQGAVGWWMVRSGLVGRVDVAPYRLATHLTLACLILAAIVWLAAGLSRASRADLPRHHAVLAAVVLAGVLIQVFLGALVAGNKAGLVYNTWPLMDGYLIPPVSDLFFVSPAWRNLFETHMTVQFNHRMMAYLLLALAIAHAIIIWRGDTQRSDREWAGSLAVLMAGQALLGIVTLLLVAPVWAALAHQAYAAVILVVAAIHARRMAGRSRRLGATRYAAAARA